MNHRDAGGNRFSWVGEANFGSAITVSDMATPAILRSTTG
jgi:hypothetical protein